MLGVVKAAVSSESLGGVRVSCALFELLKSLVNLSVSSETLGGVRASCELFELVKSESPGGVRVARRPLSRSAASASESLSGVRVARQRLGRSAASESLGRVRVARRPLSRCAASARSRRPSQTVASALLNGVRVAWRPSRQSAALGSVKSLGDIRVACLCPSRSSASESFGNIRVARCIWNYLFACLVRVSVRVARLSPSR